MSKKSFCRIGIFYDGSHFNYAQNYFYYKKKLGWLAFSPFHTMIENFIQEKEEDYAKVVYAGWYQGLFSSNQSNDSQRRIDRNRHIDLLHAGIELKHVPMSENKDEKGIDIKMAIDAFRLGIQGKIDVAVLVTGDGDFVPLVHELIKEGVRVGTVYFKYEYDEHKSFANGRLLSASNYHLNVNELEKDGKNQAIFHGLFRQSDGTNNAQCNLFANNQV